MYGTATARGGGRKAELPAEATTAFYKWKNATADVNTS